VHQLHQEICESIPIFKKRFEEDQSFVERDLTFWIQIWVSVAQEDKNIQFPHMTIERQWHERTNMNEFWHGIFKLKTICKNHLKANISFDISKLE